ncbi:MAG: TrkH family potassium uptake protein [Spirochaetales bacterium]|nr:TrkH family potassium uptake protein [Spirochaetales bacterium]
MTKDRILKIIDMVLFLSTSIVLIAIIINNGYYLDKAVSDSIYLASNILLILYIADNLLFLLMAKDKKLILKERRYAYFFLLFLVFQFLLIQLNIYSRVFSYDDKFYYFHIINQLSVFLIFIIRLSRANYPDLLSIRMNPFQVFILSFIMLILFGALLLSMPKSTTGTAGLPFSDALFTSTSAVCVTGLTVVNTATTFTASGKWIILLLIQMGGLGMMTYSSFFTLLFFNRISVTDQLMIGKLLSDSPIPNIAKLVKTIVIATFSIEALGALLLFILWQGNFYRWEEAAFYSIFHSVSAFCNAGFSLYYSNLELLRHNIPVNLVISLLVISGGIGFITIISLQQRFLSPVKKALKIHAKIILLLGAILLVSGTLLIFFFEAENSLKQESLVHKIVISFFHSVCSRTAGFNTIDISGFSIVTRVVIIMLMFIGAAPNSTSGGIKITTLGVLMATVVATFKGTEDVVLFKRRIPRNLVYRALTLVLVSMAFIFINFIIMLRLEPFPPSAILFEIVSGFGTVGLSLGITSELSWISRYLLIFIMFTGRVGPVTFTMALVKREKLKRTVYPKDEDIIIG